MNKNKKEYKDLTFLITIVLLISLSFVVLSFTIAYFASNDIKQGDITLGELDFDIVTTYTETKKIMPGDEVDVSAKIVNSVKNKKNLVPLYFRFKVLNGENFYNFITLNVDEKYIYDGNYYYYKYKVQKDKSAIMFDKIIISDKLTEKDVEDLGLILTVDAVQSEYGAYKDEFSDAPKEWVDFIENN